MNRNNEIQTELMTSMAASLPLKQLFRIVEMAIEEYKKDPTDIAEEYIIFTMHIALMGRIIQKGNRTAEELKQDLMSQDSINQLFNVNNN
jgi:hypothetical protein